MNIFVLNFNQKRWLFVLLLLTVPVSFADIIIEEHPLTQTTSVITQTEKKPIENTATSLATSPPIDKQTIIETSKAEDSVINPKNPLWEMQQQINALQNQISQLRGTVEEQSNTIDQLKTDLRVRYLDLDQRIGTLSAPVPEPTATTSADNTRKEEIKAIENHNDQAKEAPKEAIANPDDKKSFLAAYDSFRTGGPDAAILPMQNFIKNFPKSDLLTNAHYWLGEFYLNASKPNQASALKEFAMVLNTPDHSKAPSALYKIASIYDLQGKNKEAEQKMMELKKQFPKSAEAQLADDYLKALTPTKPQNKPTKKK